MNPVLRGKLLGFIRRRIAKLIGQDDEDVRARSHACGSSPRASPPASPELGEVTRAPYRCTRGNQPRRKLMRGAGRAIFAATLLIIAGIVNVAYGIGALSD